jgi:hypothetical protein
LANVKAVEPAALNAGDGRFREAGKQRRFSRRRLDPQKKAR